jgi:HAE1 family hydrophobic/amphiphilic exporter-1
MTTSAMIFGMLPLFFAIGEGAEFRAPMARAVVGGLITSTLLTLIVVPVVYSILDDISGWLFRRRKRVAQVAATGVAVALLVAAGAVPVAAQGSPEGLLLPVDGRTMVATPGSSAKDRPSEHLPGPAPQPGGAKVLTLEEALSIAAEQNRDIQKAREYQKWVEGRYVQERSAALPHGNFSANVLRNFDDTQSKLFRNIMPPGEDGGDFSDFGDIFGGRQDVRVAQFQVNQVVFTWGQVGAAIRAARLGFQVAGDQLKRFQQAVEKDVTTAFYDVLVARELAAIARQDLEQRQRHLDETKKRQSAGTATDYDVLAAQVAAENGRPPVIRAENAIRMAREQLAFLLADPGEVDVKGSLATALEPAPAYEEVLGQALVNRPELSEVASTKGIYGELVTIAKSANKPRLDFSASWGQRSLGLRTMSSRGTTWNAALVASVPLFDGWRTKGAVAQAQSDLLRLNLDELKLRDGIRLEVRNALNALRESSEIVSALRGTVEQAEKLLFLAEKGFELGVKTRLEVQDAELNVSAARANLARGQRDYRVARVNLAWVTGTIGK